MAPGAWELLGAIRQIGGALFQLTHSGTEAQQQEAKEVLAETRRALYRILAEDEPDDDEDALPGDAGPDDDEGPAQV